jgi:hypothetical protein
MGEKNEFSVLIKVSGSILFLARKETYQGISGSANVCCCQHSHDGKTHLDGGWLGKINRIGRTVGFPDDSGFLC